MDNHTTNESMQKRVKKAGKVSTMIAKSAIWYPLKIVLMVLWKLLSYTLNILFTVILVGVITGIVVGCAFILYIQGNIDAEYDGLDNLQFDSELNTTLYYIDNNGNEVLMQDDTLYSKENRLWVDINDIPDNLVNALIAIEDQRFYTHNGMDLKRTLGAVLNFVMPGGSSYGGSTITQQLIKNVSKEDDVTIQRKIQEIFRAMNVEKNFSKQQILEMYLNIIFLSQNSTGVRTASYAYFNKDVTELNLLECVALMAIPKYPTYYDPIRNPDNNLQRRNVILQQMLEQGFISQEEFDGAYNMPLYIDTGKDETETTTIHNYYVDAVIEDVKTALMELYDIDNATASRKLYSGGLEIVINMDPYIQEIMEKVYTDEQYFPEATGVKPQSAMVIMDPKTGNVLGIVGGRGEKKISRGLNRATQSFRQCGSSIKPLSIYALAIERGLVNYGSAVEDTPSLYLDDNYWPANNNKKFEGLVPLTYAVETSLNTVPVRLGLQLGEREMYNFLVEKLGFTSLVERGEYGGQIKSDIAISPMALGSFTKGVSVLEMTQAYTMFANGGTVSKARTFSVIRDSKGNIIINNTGTDNQISAISEESAYVMSKLLENVVKKSNGTAEYMFNYKEGREPSYTTHLYNFQGKMELGGKTGSTNDDRDRYFMGFTPDLVGGVWFGYDSNKSLTKFKYNPATRLWIEVFSLIYEGYDNNGVPYNTEFTRPSNIVESQYCSLSGKIKTEACDKDLQKVLGKSSSTYFNNYTGYFASNDSPIDYCDVHVMVKWDKTTESVCFDEYNTCPEGDLIDVSLRRIEQRIFNKNLSILDSIYTYVNIPSGYTFPTSGSVPFFQNLYSSGTYPGGTGSTQYNSVCAQHHH